LANSVVAVRGPSTHSCSQQATLFSTIRINKALELKNQAALLEEIASLYREYGPALETNCSPPRVEVALANQKYTSLISPLSLCEKSWLLTLVPEIFQWERSDPHAHPVEMQQLEARRERCYSSSGLATDKTDPATTYASSATLLISSPASLFEFDWDLIGSGAGDLGDGVRDCAADLDTMSLDANNKHRKSITLREPAKSCPDILNIGIQQWLSANTTCPGPEQTRELADIIQYWENQDLQSASCPTSTKDPQQSSKGEELDKVTATNRDPKFSITRYSEYRTDLHSYGRGIRRGRFQGGD